MTHSARCADMGSMHRRVQIARSAIVAMVALLYFSSLGVSNASHAVNCDAPVHHNFFEDGQIVEYQFDFAMQSMSYKETGNKGPSSPIASAAGLTCVVEFSSSAVKSEDVTALRKRFPHLKSSPVDGSASYLDLRLVDLKIHSVTPVEFSESSTMLFSGHDEVDSLFQHRFSFLATASTGRVLDTFYDPQTPFEVREPGKHTPVVAVHPRFVCSVHTYAKQWSQGRWMAAKAHGE